MHLLTAAYGTSRQFAATQHIGRFRGEADMGRKVKSADSVANDPTRTSAIKFVAMHSSAREEPEKAAGAAGHRRPYRSVPGALLRSIAAEFHSRRFDPRSGGVLAFYAAVAVAESRKIDKVTSNGVALTHSRSTSFHTLICGHGLDRQDRLVVESLVGSVIEWQMLAWVFTEKGCRST